MRVVIQQDLTASIPIPGSCSCSLASVVPFPLLFLCLQELDGKVSVALLMTCVDYVVTPVSPRTSS